MPSRYFTNFIEKFYHPTPRDFFCIVHNLLIWKFLAAVFSLAYTSAGIGAFSGV